MMHLQWILFILCILNNNIINNNAQEDFLCTSKCSCKTNTQRDGGRIMKMSCGGEIEKIAHVDELELPNIASELVQLNLSNNYLKKFKPKVELIVLQKLNLSNNQLTYLEQNQFKETPKLRRLDLSFNSIKHIDINAFLGLQDLERLKLNHNDLFTISFGTLDAMPKLRQLDISSNQLQCDCGLLWILDYTEKNFLKLISNPKCSSTFVGIPLRKLKVGVDIHCKSANDNSPLPLLDLKPENNQVVFEGDSLKLNCRAPSITDSAADSKLNWLWLDVDPKDRFENISIINNFLRNPGLINSVLHIKNLTKSHTGIWTCSFASLQGNHSKSTTILVISDDTRYCPITTVKNNKGIYIFPKTIANHTVSLPCNFSNNYYDFSQTATYYCSINGTWENLNTSRCSYISDTTRILEGFAKVNASVLESGRHLKDFTANITIFKDLMDLEYTVESLEKYLQLQQQSEPLNNILMDILNNLMNLSWTYLQSSNDCCSRILKIIQELAFKNPSTLFQRENFLIEAFPNKKDPDKNNHQFTGIKCLWFKNEGNSLDALFSCSTNNNIPDSTILQGKSIETSLVVPANAFIYENNVESETENSLIVSMYSSSKFFPIDQPRWGKEAVLSAVVGVKSSGLYKIETREPIFVTIRTPESTSFEITPFTPVYWDFNLGIWSNNGCKFENHWQEHVVFSCKKLGYYGLMQEATNLNYTSSSYKGYLKLSHPAIYVGNFIIITAFLIAILTYIFGFSSIQMPKKAKHCLINTWSVITILCFIYTFGIYQTEDQKLCQIIGLILHYLTLSSLLWMCVIINCMYKRLSKNSDSILQDDDLPSELPIKKPIMGLYLVGWGVALIVCGLSAAINVKEYASNSHCFLRSGPALSALYVPFTILLLFMIIFFLLVRCAISNLDLSHGGHLSEGTQVTEHVDLDLLEPFPSSQQNTNHNDSRSVRSYSSSETDDNERSPLAQLKAHIIFVALFLITWISCAFATVPPATISLLITYEVDLFSGIYAASAITLSIFTLFFYCVARNDVRVLWMSLFRWIRKKHLIRSRTVSDTPPRVQIQSLSLPPVSNSEILTRSSSRSSDGRSKTNYSLKGAAALNGSSVSDNNKPASLLGGGSKINNVNLIVLHRAQYRANVVPHIIENPTNAAEVFYNPHQSTVARKFFRKQRRDMMKRNNLQSKPPRDLNSDVASVFSEPPNRPIIKNRNAEQNYFGTNSKVNNTNIHVEHSRNKAQRTNPNLFSDSGDDDFDALSDVPIEKLVINAERLRKREISRNRTRKKSNNLMQENLTNKTNAEMRTVSQQCTLEYSSDNPLSDSVLDKCDLLSPTKLIQESSKLNQEEEPISSIVLIETSGTTETTAHLSTRRENSPVEQEPHYAEIDEELRGSSNLTNKRNLARLKSPLTTFSRTSSASATDIDELYQQIRRGPLLKSNNDNSRILRGQHFNNLPQRAYSSPFLSDSDTHTSFIEINHKAGLLYDNDDDDDEEEVEDVETTV